MCRLSSVSALNAGGSDQGLAQTMIGRNLREQLLDRVDAERAQQFLLDRRHGVGHERVGTLRFGHCGGSPDRAML